jgi:shikimate kinase
MASGKSTIGRKLARKLGWPFFDTDSLVVRDHGPIATIFANEGEPAFRQYEHAAICEVFGKANASVVALGGGALTVEKNRAILADCAFRIFIKVTPEQVLARVLRSRDVRPVLGSAPTLVTIQELYGRRLPEYERADRVIDASHQSDANVVDEIATWLRER